MGKQRNKWQSKQDRLRLALGWGKKKEVEPIAAGVNCGLCVADFEKARRALLRVERVPIWANDVLAAFKPKSVSDPAKPLNNGWSYGDWLVKRGFKLLGRGAYSRVYGKDGSDRVIKVTAGSQDDWIDYIQWAAKKGYCGNFAPRVYSWKKLQGRDGTTYSVSVVERMAYTLSEEKAGDARLISDLMYAALSRKSLMAQVYMDDLAPGSVAFLSDLTSSFDSNDIYGKNMMVRKDGSFCVTDPVCGQCRTTVNRLRSSDFTSLSPALRICLESCYRY